MRRKTFLSLVLFILLASQTVWAARSDSTAKDTSAVPRKSPLVAVFFSAVLPGGGQIYTRNYWRAAGLGTAEVGLAGAALVEVWRMDKATDQAEVNQHFEKQRSLWWWTAGVWAFSMADAYVDAYLYRFDEQGRVAVRADSRRGLALVLEKDL